MLLFIDGMGHYDTPYIPRKWTSLDPEVTSAWTIEATGREVNCIQKVTDANGAVEAIGVAPLMTQDGPWTPTVSGVFGAAMRVNLLSLINDQGTSPFPYLFQIMEANAPQLLVRLNTNGTFTLLSGSGGSVTTLAHSVEGVLSDTWFEFEAKWLIDDTTGTFEIRINRVTILSFTGNTASPLAPLGVWNSIKLLGMPWSGTDPLIWRFCDVYLADLAGSGDDVRDFLGVFPIDYIVPDGVGATTGWTPSAGANWQCVDEVPPNGDTDYVSATAVATRDTYAFQNIPVGTTVLGTQQLILARKEDAGGASLQPVVRQGSTDYDGPEQGIPSEDYYYLIQPYDVNPATGAKFTDTEINNGQFGQVKAS